MFGPVVAKRLAAPAEADADRARQIVATSGGDTLAYFALRDDKRWYFHGETLIAYAVTQGVALVSPDPIGPVADRRRAWFAFRQLRRRPRVAHRGDGRVGGLVADLPRERACARCTWATRRWPTCSGSRSKAGATRVSARP